MSKTENKETVENELVVLEEVLYPVSTDEIKAFLAEWKDVPTIDPDAENAGELYQMVLKGHKASVKFRTSIEKKRKELKAPALEYGKNVDAIAKEFQAMINPKELELFTQRKIVEDNEQRKQDELIAKERERVDTLNSKVNIIKDLPLKWMNEPSDAIQSILDSMSTPIEEEFEEFTDVAIVAHNISFKQLTNLVDTKTKAENTERLEREAEEKRKVEAEALEAERTKEREEFEAEKAEFAKQKQEQERFAQEQQEDINRQNANQEAKELEEQQEQEKTKKEQDDKLLFSKSKDEALEDIRDKDLLQKIIDGKIRHINFVV